MSENQNRGSVDFGKYDAMTTEELEEILRLDAEMPESDTDKILYIMEVLEERKTKNSHAGNTTLKAYESFKRNYMPETDNNTIPVKSNRRSRRWLRSLTAAAAVLAILLIGSVTAKAFGFNIWKNVVQWSQDTFHFGNSGSAELNSNLTYDSLQDALEQEGITTAIEPSWFPDGYELADITVDVTPQRKTFKAIYTCGEEILIITVKNHLDGSPVYIEQSDGIVEEYRVIDTVYYLLANQGQYKAVWIYASYECDISGNVTIEELKKMVDSIQKG